MRLHAVSPDRIIPDQLVGFEEPNTADTWREYLRRIPATHTPGYAFGHTLTTNLAHRLQLLEFETALLLHHKESLANNHHAALHVCVLFLKIHQHIVLCHSILEGIGSHFKRFQRSQAGLAMHPERRVEARQWRAAILDISFPSQTQADRTALTGELEDLTAWRDKVHLDTIKPNARLHYHDFGMTTSFVPTYRLFKRILAAMNPQWPNATCLNEVI